jgi:hypothetical protein
VLFSSTTGMSVMIGLGDDGELYDWFIPEEKRPDLPLEKSTGTSLPLSSLPFSPLSSLHYLLSSLPPPSLATSLPSTSLATSLPSTSLATSLPSTSSFVYSCYRIRQS